MRGCGEPVRCCISLMRSWRHECDRRDVAKLGKLLVYKKGS